MQRKPEPERLSVTVREAVELTGLGQNTIYDLIGDGTLESAKIGGRRLIIFTSLKAMLERGVERTPRGRRRRDEGSQSGKAA